MGITFDCYILKLVLSLAFTLSILLTHKTSLESVLSATIHSDLQIVFGHAQQRSCFQVSPSLRIFCQQFHRYLG